MTYSEHELEFTFAKNDTVLIIICEIISGQSVFLLRYSEIGEYSSGKLLGLRSPIASQAGLQDD